MRMLLLFLSATCLADVHPGPSPSPTQEQITWADYPSLSFAGDGSEIYTKGNATVDNVNGLTVQDPDPKPIFTIDCKGVMKLRGKVVMKDKRLGKALCK